MTTKPSPVLVFLVRLLTLVIASIVWLLVLIASALVVFLHLVAVALSKATDAALSLFIAAEAAAHKDMVSAFGELSGRATGPDAPAAGLRRLPDLKKAA